MADDQDLFQVGKSMVQEDDDSAFFTDAPDESKISQNPNAIP